MLRFAFVSADDGGNPGVESRFHEESFRIRCAIAGNGFLTHAVQFNLTQDHGLDLDGLDIEARIAARLRTAAVHLWGLARTITEGQIDVLVINSHGGLYHTVAKSLVTPHLYSSTLETAAEDTIKVRRPEDLDPVMTFLLLGSTGRTGTLLAAEHLRNEHVFPDVPSTLFFAMGCSAGWTPDLAAAVIDRGCRFFIGHRVETNLAKSGHIDFFRRWKKKGLDADAIPRTFAKWAVEYPYGYPVLYEQGSDGRLKATMVRTQGARSDGKPLRLLQATLGERVDLEFVDTKKRGIYEE